MVFAIRLYPSQRSDEMDKLGCLLFVLLFSSLVADGQSSDCSKSSLKNGYFVPEENTYKHGRKITYACEKGYKRREEGWWGTSECVNGTWSPEPVCIDENEKCFAPDVPNAKTRRVGAGRVLIECEAGYEIDTTTTSTIITCKDGEWSTGSCTKSATACGAPAFVSDAVIIHKYQDTFGNKEAVKYKCKDSYNLEGSMMSVCQDGKWSSPPKCLPKFIETTPAPRSVRPSPAADDRTDDTGATTQNRVQPLKFCGTAPDLKNGLVSQLDESTLLFRCSAYYKREGPKRVFCLENGKWSTQPVCLEPCSVPRTNLPKGMKQSILYIEEGTTTRFFCYQNWRWQNTFLDVGCFQGKPSFGECQSH
ncbi:complement factor H-related protein 1-like [Osmerus mordax]|uniref:complement factor H-related protein 1-like n=1 Tax=Osmerus mordax TaxID=8014 RepID=UPI00350FFE75